MPQHYTDPDMARTVAVCISHYLRNTRDYSDCITRKNDDGYEILIDRRFCKSPSEPAHIWQLTEHGSEQWMISCISPPNAHAPMNFTYGTPNREETR